MEIFLTFSGIDIEAKNKARGTEAKPAAAETLFVSGDGVKIVRGRARIERCAVKR
jgi:hypothetical protein